MNFDIPQELQDYLKELDEFIEQEIKPLEQENDNIRFFDHRREDARTDWERGGLPNEEWEALLGEARRRADVAGHYRYLLPKEYGGKDGSNLGMAIIREYLAARGLGLHNDLQTEHSIVGNNVGLLLMLAYGTENQRQEWVPEMLEARRSFAFAITEPDTGFDTTRVATTAVAKGADTYIINGQKAFCSRVKESQILMLVARTTPYEEAEKRWEAELVQSMKSFEGLGNNPKKGGVWSRENIWTHLQSEGWERTPSTESKVTRFIKRVCDWGMMEKVEHNAYIILNNELTAND